MQKTKSKLRKVLLAAIFSGAAFYAIAASVSVTVGSTTITWTCVGNCVVNHFSWGYTVTDSAGGNPTWSIE